MMYCDVNSDFCAIEVIEIMVNVHTDNEKSPYAAVYHYDLKGTLRNCFQPLVAVLYYHLPIV